MSTQTQILICDVSIHEDVVFEAGMPEDQLQLLSGFTVEVMAQTNITPPMSVSIHITTDDHVRELNSNYRKVYAPTDILSFQAEPLPPGVEEAPHLGDLIFSYEYTMRQALAENHAPLDEFKMLIIHGILHLIGYTHDAEDEERDMWAHQGELLKHFGINITVPHYIHGRDDV
jgi:probable rRNA maturation factor